MKLLAMALAAMSTISETLVCHILISADWLIYYISVQTVFTSQLSKNWTMKVIDKATFVNFRLFLQAFLLGRHAPTYSVGESRC